MIPGAGLIATILSVWALYSLWDKPPPGLWWGILGLLVLNSLFKRTLQEASRQAGEKLNDVVKFWIVLCLLAQLSLIGLSAYAIWG